MQSSPTCFDFNITFIYDTLVCQNNRNDVLISPAFFSSPFLQYSTKHSLVLIDELGRGTTTFDGCAIAHSVAKFLTRKKCRTLFSTHYHELMREFNNRDNMKIYHMSIIEDEGDDVVFMYTVASGPCSKSHGFNAAKLAGLPSEIISNGQEVAKRFEEKQENLLKLAEILCV